MVEDCNPKFTVVRGFYPCCFLAVFFGAEVRGVFFQGFLFGSLFNGFKKCPC